MVGSEQTLSALSLFTANTMLLNNTMAATLIAFFAADEAWYVLAEMHCEQWMTLCSLLFLVGGDEVH